VDEPVEEDVDQAEGGADRQGDHYDGDRERARLLERGPGDLAKLGDRVFEPARYREELPLGRRRPLTAGRGSDAAKGRRTAGRRRPFFRRCRFLSAKGATHRAFTFSQRGEELFLPHLAVRAVHPAARAVLVKRHALRVVTTVFLRRVGALAALRAG